MVSMIKGKTIILYEKIQTGVDGFNKPIYDEKEVLIDNVLIEPASEQDITNEIEINGKQLSYYLHIPKNDDHDWNDVSVYFYGKRWKSYGEPLRYDEDLTPLSWNQKVKVERYE